jgi:hypothetical protein
LTVSILSEGQELTPEKLVKKVVDEGVLYVQNNIVPKMAAKIAVIVTPGAGVISTIYNGITFVLDNVNKFAGLKDVVVSIASQLGDLAKGTGGAVDKLADDVKTFLNKVMPIAINL